jgi:ABC-type multidrug transport system ATPase subunit
MIEVVLEGVSRSFADRRVLEGLSATFRGGERVLVRGPNGSGKSTLLRILAGVLAPTGGGVRVQDGDTPRDPAWCRRWTGYMAPDLHLYDEFSPLENLTFFGMMRGLGKNRSRDEALLGRLGLGKRLDDPLGTLSTGLRARAKLAFALQGRPRILLLDEPGSNLDAAGRGLIEGAVGEYAGEGALVVIASNDPAEFSLGTRTLELV